MAKCSDCKKLTALRLSVNVRTNYKYYFPANARKFNYGEIIK